MQDWLNPQPSDLSHTSGRDAITAREAIKIVLEQCGNLSAAADKLNRVHDLPPDDKLKPQDVQALIADDMPALQKAIRASITVQLYTMMDLAVAKAVESIPHLEPGESIRGLSQLTNLLSALTDDKTSTVNLNVEEYVWKHELTPETRQIMAQLKALEAASTPQLASGLPAPRSGTQPKVIDNDYNPPDNDD